MGTHNDEIKHARAHCSQIESLVENSTGDEKRTLYVVILTLATMVLEIAFGMMSGSMALLADGWHMGTHAFALGISYAAFRMARQHAKSGVFSFGTGKFSVLSGYTSSLFLGAAGVWMIAESATRLIHPVNISYTEAIAVAVFGLLINLLSIFILGGDDHHAHSHEEVREHAGAHDHKHPDAHHDEDSHEHMHEHDHNYKAAYLHVLADALTSVLAIGALLSGMFIGWSFLDPFMGIVGGLMIIRWSWKLLKETAAILLDADECGDIRAEIIEHIESDSQSRVDDLHVWFIGSHNYAAIVSVRNYGTNSSADYRARLEHIKNLVHLSIELIESE